MNIVSLLLAALPLLKQYFTKNAGMNSVTSGAVGVFGTLAVLASQNTANIDQAITFFSNYGKTGLYVAGAIAALRTFIFIVSPADKSSS